MTEIIPRADTDEMDAILAGAIPVRRFVTQRDDSGDVAYFPPRCGGGVLCTLKFKDVHAKGFLATGEAIKPVKDLNPAPYRTLQFEVDSERDFNIKSLSELGGMIPSEERGKFAYFEPVYVGIGAHGEGLAEIRLYERA